jgi:pyruvate-formate lyase-activating enzyme
MLLRAPYFAQQEIETLMEKDTLEEFIVDGVKIEIKDKDDDDADSVTSVSDWKKDHAKEEAFQILEAINKTEQVYLSELLVICIENNLQSLEVVEQWLLLIRHLLVTSKLAYQALQAEGIMEWLKRIITLQSSNTYIIALTEICLDKMIAASEM